MTSDTALIHLDDEVLTSTTAVTGVAGGAMPSHLCAAGAHVLAADRGELV